MRGIIIVVIGFVVLTVSSGQLHARVNPSAASARATPADATRLTIAKANALMGQEEWKAAVGQFANAIESAGFDGLSADEQYTALIRAAGVAIDLGDAAAAHRWLLRATTHPRAADIDWHRRLSSAFDLGNYADSAICITTIARRWPDTLAQINPVAIYRVAGRLGTDPALATTQREYLDSLFDTRWTDDGVAPDGLWLDLVRLQMLAGNVDKAAIVAKRIAHPRMVLALLVDKRYDTLTRQHGFQRDLEAVTATALLRAEARLRAAPDRLEPLSELQALLLDERQFSRVLTTSDDVIRRAGSGEGASDYTDFDEKYPWILDNRSLALLGLGRWEEALAQLRKAARRPVEGGMNVSQSLNLGLLYAQLDRATDAREMIEETGSISDYGRMVRETIALMAAVSLDDTDALAKHLVYLRDHREDAIDSYQDALMTTGPIDAAADLLIERLRSERWRSAALILIQEYAEVPMTPWRQRYNQRLRQIIAMPRVQAEINRLGRIEKLKRGPPLL